jgi:hypothetical protein
MMANSLQAAAPTPESEPAPWALEKSFAVEIEFSEPAKGQEAKLNKKCSGRCTFTGATGRCMDVDGTVLEGLEFSVEMNFSSTQTQTWKGVLRDPREDGTGGNVYLGNSGCVAVGEVESDPETRDIVFEMVLRYTVTSPQRLAHLAKGNPAHLDTLTKQSLARAGTYMCKLSVLGSW